MSGETKGECHRKGMDMGHKQHHHDHDGNGHHAASSHESGRTNGNLELHERIKLRAYELSCTGQGGSDLQNWLQAEQEIAAAAAEHVG